MRLDLVADGEARVPRWAASREKELFARAFGRELRGRLRRRRLRTAGSSVASPGPTGTTTGTICGCSRETASATSSSIPNADPSHWIRTRLVGTRSSASTGRPQSSSKSISAWSTGLSRIALAGTGQLALCWSSAALIAPRFFAANWLTGRRVAALRPVIPGCP